MGTFKDAYDIIKDLLQAAKHVQNQEVVQLALNLQEKFFELREDNDNLLMQIAELKKRIDSLEEAKVKETDIKYYCNGFLTLNTETNKLPYCSYCWKKEHRLYPLAQYGSWFKYRCSSCKAEIIVMSADGKPIVY